MNLVAVWPHLGDVRVPGVLQRIGLTYLIAAFVVLSVRPRGQVAIAAALVLAHWALLVLVPFDGQPAGTLTPVHNLAAYVDTSVFGRHTLTPAGDPEGLLGLMPSIATALLGSAAGWYISASTSVQSRLVGLGTAGVSIALLGLVWSSILPLNKALWTGSYALFASGLAALTLALCYLLIDVARIDRWARPFIWLGVNPLAVYFLSELVGRLIERPMMRQAHGLTAIKELVFWSWIVPRVGDAGGAWSSCAFGVLYTALWIGVAGLLDRNGVRIRT